MAEVYADTTLSGLPLWPRREWPLDVLSLRVRLLSADLRIPIRRRIGEELTLPAEVAHRFFIDFDAQARPRRNGDVTLNHEVPFVG